MRLFALLFLLTIVLPLGGGVGVPAQRTPPPPPAQTPQTPQPDGQEVVTTRLVRLPVIVLDNKKQPVVGLTQNDFLIFEDKQPQTIDRFFDDKAELPIYVAVLMDTSSSTAGKLRFEQEAAKDFIYTVIRLRKDKVAFGTFDDEVRLVQDFTDKLDLLDKAVDSVKKPGQQTALYDAVWEFCDQKMRNVTGKRVIVVITDGDDTYSRARLRDAIDIAQRTETVVFAISTKAGFSGVVPGVEAGTIKDQGDKDLDKLCDETGGRAFFTGDRLALERSFTQVARELRAQYLITYKPTRAFDGSYRQIEVRLTDSRRKGLKINTRRGYTATDDSIKRP